MRVTGDICVFLAHFRYKKTFKVDIHVSTTKKCVTDKKLILYKALGTMYVKLVVYILQDVVKLLLLLFF